MSHIGLFGGTFDPVHFGHLRSALELGELLQLKEVRMIPCHKPPHRPEPRASSEHRLAMLQLAVAESEGLVADDRELKRNHYSYTVDTLEGLVAEFPEQKLLLFTGIDAFSGFKSWHRWERILELADLIVIARPQADFSKDAQDLLKTRQAANLNDRSLKTGNILIRELTQLDISSTRLRGIFRDNQRADFLLPRVVQNYIEEYGLYRE